MLSKIEEILWVKIIIRAVIAALLTFVIILSWEVYLEHIVDAWKGSPFSESFNHSPVSYLHGTEIIIETTVTAFLVILLYSWYGYRADKTRQQWMNSSVEKSLYLESIIKNVADAVIIIDDDGKILNFNDSAVEMFGYSHDEVIRKSITVIMPMCQQRNHQQYINKHISTDNPTILDKGEREVTAQRKNGEQFPLMLSVSKLDTGNGVVFIGTMRDITERKKAERELTNNFESLQEAQRTIEEQNHDLMGLAEKQEEAKNTALAANKTKSEFLANMSHELRTPLNAIIGFSEVMLSKVGGELSDKHKEYVDDILCSGNHLLELINDILDLSKIEAGKTEIYSEKIDVCSIFRSCMALMAERAQEKLINIEVKTSCDGLYVYADSIRLKQIILNLLSNSVKFTDMGGKIDISCAIGDKVIITIEDNGIGMDEEGLQAAIMKFGQVNTGLSRTYEGTGLGLPLSIELAKLMDGSLDIVSELGIGTTVTVTLPKAE